MENTVKRTLQERPVTASTREAYPERPVWIYENAWYISDLKANNMNGLRFEVAQLSDRFGPGPSAYMIISENLEIRA